MNKVPCLSLLACATAGGPASTIGSRILTNSINIQSSFHQNEPKKQEASATTSGRMNRPT